MDNNGSHKIIEQAMARGVISCPSNWGSMTPTELKHFAIEAAEKMGVEKEGIDRAIPTDAVVYAERLKICQQCEYQLNMRCYGTDASRDVGAIAKQKLSTCPVGRWMARWTPVEDYPSLTVERDKLVITVATGKFFRELLEITRPCMQDYANAIGADYVELTNETQTWWGLEKFRIKPFAELYERTIYIDADAIVTSRARNLFDVVPEGSIGIHNDYPYFTHYDWIPAEREQIMVSQGVDFVQPEMWVNAGVVVFDRLDADIFTPPPHAFVPTHCSEQLWIEQEVCRRSVYELPLSLNCQYWIPGFWDVLGQAEIVHLSACPDSDRLEIARKIAQW